ncbi:MAG: hypothetical protein ABSC34_11375 [Acidimicrobiales bacterium]|jgi:hypothetical protein
MDIRNTSTAACAVAIGPTSPSMTIANDRGAVVWNNCYSDDRPGACAMFLMLHAIVARGVYVITRTWDQRSGSDRALVARGTYWLTANLSGVRATSKITFSLTA